MLTDDRTGIDTDNFSVGKSLLKLCHCFCIVSRLCVGGAENGTIENDKICIRGRQSLAIGNDSVGEGEGNEPIGCSLARAQQFQLFFHSFEIFILFVCLIFADDVQ